jgi:hypothetical protein
MKSAQDLLALSSQLAQFLSDAGWRRAAGKRGLSFYFPPAALGMQGGSSSEYSIALPDESLRPGAERIVHDAAEAVRRLYGGHSLDAMLEDATALSMEAAGAATLTSRFVDKSTVSGSMPLLSIKEYLLQLERSLYHSAKFKLGGDSPLNQAAAESFAQGCRFLQTSVGSFVTQVEIPAATLRQADLLGQGEVQTAHVGAAMFSAIEFLVARVLNPETDLDDPDRDIETVMGLFSIDSVDALAKLLIGPGMERVEFAFSAGRSQRRADTGQLTVEKVERLNEFVSFIKRHLTDERDLDVMGAIIELRSRNPEGDRNYIRLVTKYQGDRTIIGATLTNDQYQLAVDAHKKSRAIRLVGNGIRMKTQIRMRKVDELEIVSPPKSDVGTP